MVHNMEFGPHIKHICSYTSCPDTELQNTINQKCKIIMTLMGPFLSKTSTTLNIFHVKHIL